MSCVLTATVSQLAGAIVDTHSPLRCSPPSPPPRSPTELLAFALVCYSLQVNGRRRRPGDGGDEAVVAPELQAGGFVLLRRHCFVALVDAERLVSLAVADHRRVVAVIRQGLHVVRDLRVRKRKTDHENALEREDDTPRIVLELFLAVLRHQLLILLLVNIHQNKDC